jgi:hypothetical protein
MSTNEDTTNPKTDMAETDSDDMTWDKKLEANTLEEEQQKKHGSENDTGTDSDEVDGEQQVEENEDEEQEDEVNVDEDQEQAFRIVCPNDSEDDSKKKGSRLGEKKKLAPVAKKTKEKTPASKGGRSYRKMNNHDHTWTYKFIKWQEYTLENDGNGRVPRDYKTPDGFALGYWQHRQSKLYKDGDMAACPLDKLEYNDFPFKKQTCNFRYTPACSHQITQHIF